jgi:hypothetical protein
MAVKNDGESRDEDEGRGETDWDEWGKAEEGQSAKTGSHFWYLIP